MLSKGESGTKARRLYLAALRDARSDTPTNVRIAAKLRRAADMGSDEATYALATWYLFGVHFKKSVKTGIVLLKRAANAGNADACYDLAVSYDNGLGVPKDRQKAFELYLEAALRGDVEAHRQVARCFWNGSGVNRNRRLADLWGERHQRLVKIKGKAAQR